MFRLLIWGLLIYFGLRLLKSLFLSDKSSQGAEIRGKGANDPLDLSKADVEDAVFRDIDDRKSSPSK